MKQEINEIEVNGVQYVRKDSVKDIVAMDGDYPIMMVRTFSAGVFYGGLKSRIGKEVILVNARRVWSWSGAASLSQLAQSGTSDPSNCKFPEAVSEVTLTEAIEIIPVSDLALKTLTEVKVWKC